MSEPQNRHAWSMQLCRLNVLDHLQRLYAGLVMQNFNPSQDLVSLADGESYFVGTMKNAVEEVRESNALPSDSPSR